MKKPGCGHEIMSYFREHPETGVTAPHQIAVVGDRLSTDMMLANMMGSWGVWVRDGVVPHRDKSIVCSLPKITHSQRLQMLIHASSSPEQREHWAPISSPVGIQHRTLAVRLNEL